MNKFYIGIHDKKNSTSQTKHILVFSIGTK